MSKSVIDTSKTEQLIVSVPSRELAEKVRAYILENYTSGTWIFVYLLSDNSFEVRGTNEWGAKLKPEFLEKLQKETSEISGVALPEPEDITEHVELVESSGTNTVQEV